MCSVSVKEVLIKKKNNCETRVIVGVIVRKTTMAPNDETLARHHYKAEPK